MKKTVLAVLTIAAVPVSYTHLIQNIPYDHSDLEVEEQGLEQAMADFEGKIVRQAYEKYKTTVGVAKALKISQPTAFRKIEKYRKE